jgi:hypothetical protein
VRPAAPSLATMVTGISRPALVVSLAVAAAILGVGALTAVAWLGTHTERHTRVVPAARAIEVRVGSGDVTVVATDRRDVRVTSTERHGIVDAKAHVSSSGGVLRLNCDQGVFVFGPCGVGFRIEVPRASSVRVVAHSGDVSVHDLGGAADLSTHSGDVEADGVRGPLRLRARSGDVAVRVPAGGYAVVTATRSGDERVSLANDPRSPRTIRATTRSGDVSVGAF